MFNIKNIDDVYDRLLKLELFTREELRLITEMYGHTLKTLDLACMTRNEHIDHLMESIEEVFNDL